MNIGPIPRYLLSDQEKVEILFSSGIKHKLCPSEKWKQNMSRLAGLLILFKNLRQWKKDLKYVVGTVRCDIVPIWIWRWKSWKCAPRGLWLGIFWIGSHFASLLSKERKFWKLVYSWWKDTLQACLGDVRHPGQTWVDCLLTPFTCPLHISCLLCMPVHSPHSPATALACLPSLAKTLRFSPLESMHVSLNDNYKIPLGFMKDIIFCEFKVSLRLSFYTILSTSL